MLLDLLQAPMLPPWPIVMHVNAFLTAGFVSHMTVRAAGLGRWRPW
jgi:hypothetical protein